jgi:hypothetical protein
MKPARVLFICGSINQTTQMHDIARELPDIQPLFTPYYGSRIERPIIAFGLAERTIAGRRLRARCLEYLERQDLRVDLDGGTGGYDLVVTCSDLVIPENVRGVPLVAVQEGILDREGILWGLVHRYPHRVPRWLSGTAGTGLSGAYSRFCVASSGYRDLFIGRGAEPERVVVTGIPNFDDCAKFLRNDFPYRNYVLVCTSDVRETFKIDRRRRFIRSAVAIARGRPLFFKLHPNERVDRATREIALEAPGATVFSTGPTEAMIANADVLITQYSSTAFVGLALGKEVHSYHPLEELRALLPEQNGCAARNIARVCTRVLGSSRDPSAAFASPAELHP